MQPFLYLSHISIKLCTKNIEKIICLSCWLNLYFYCFFAKYKLLIFEKFCLNFFFTYFLSNFPVFCRSVSLFVDNVAPNDRFVALFQVKFEARRPRTTFCLSSLLPCFQSVQMTRRIQNRKSINQSTFIIKEEKKSISKHLSC